MVDLLIIGGGIAGLSTAKAAVEAGLTVELIEKGTICGQGATAAAKQGHVYVPDGSRNASERSEAFRIESLRIYKEMAAAKYDLGFRQTGAARPFVADSWWERLVTKLEWWTYQRATEKLYDTALLDGSKLEAQQNLHDSLGAMWDVNAGSVTPCKVLDAWKTYIKALGGVIREETDLLSIETKTYPFTMERMYNVELSRVTLGTIFKNIPITRPGGWVQARSVVVAAGYWHNEVMKKHFASCDHGPDVVGVASQMAIYTLAKPLPPTPSSVFSYSAGAGLQEVAPARFQASKLGSCKEFAPSYFLTSCKGNTWARCAPLQLVLALPLTRADSIALDSRSLRSHTPDRLVRDRVGTWGPDLVGIWPKLDLARRRLAAVFYRHPARAAG